MKLGAFAEDFILSTIHCLHPSILLQYSFEIINNAEFEVHETGFKDSVVNF
ncbi:hypothetical protein Leryth_022555 [Lithospermum erythrorhizon]|nr:hypothetical protein Leryth_022555 [Lithospermum erythrorhizon]